LLLLKQISIAINATKDLKMVVLSIHNRGQFHTLGRSSYGSASLNIQHKKQKHISSGYIQYAVMGLKRTQVTKLDMERGRCDKQNMVNIQDCINKHKEDKINCTIPLTQTSHDSHPMCDNYNQGHNFSHS
jgi:hypothetical protein